jgi:hypothetical protein
VTLQNELSTAERNMFQKLGWDYLFHTDIGAMNLYRMATEKCFIENKDNAAVHALRRAMKHFAEGGYRGNKPFDQLISF